MLVPKNITHILITGNNMNKFFEEKFVYHQIFIDDKLNNDISLYFNECFDFIDKGSIVFVHCHAGVSRSATIVMAYLMRKLKLRYNDAYNYVKKCRKKVHPNKSYA